MGHIGFNINCNSKDASANYHVSAEGCADLPTSVHIAKLYDSDDDVDFVEADDFEVEDERSTIKGAMTMDQSYNQKGNSAAYQTTQVKKVKLLKAAREGENKVQGVVNQMNVSPKYSDQVKTINFGGEALNL